MQTFRWAFSPICLSFHEQLIVFDSVLSLFFSFNSQLSCLRLLLTYFKFSEEDIKIVNKYIKRYLISLIVWKMKIYISMNDPFTFVGMVIIKKTRKNKC